MKLKLVVASMSMLGLIASPVFADTAQTTQTTQTTQTLPKHKHHHHKKVVVVHHHYVDAQPQDYKAMGALPTIVVPQVDTYQIMYDAMSQNTGRSKAMPDWFNRIGVSGGLNVDGHWGNRSQGYMGENYTRVSLNDAYLNIAANVNDWTKALASLSYSNFSATSGRNLGSYSTAYTNNQINLEQGYLTVANYDVSPLFFQVGKQYSDYGRYQIHALVRTMSQVMTESLQTSAKLGFITRMGLHGDISAFSNPSIQFANNHSNTVYGAALGFDQINDQLGYDLGIGYMSDLTGVNDIQNMMGNTPVGPHNYVHTVGGISLYGDVNSGPFSVSARYTTAIQNFNPNDLSTQFHSNVGNGAKPWAADLTAGYAFNGWNKNQNVYVGYQASNNAVNLALPKSRWLAGYNVDMWKNTNVGLEWDHDNAYSSGHGGNGNNTNIVGARASVKFG
jgi:hypothetical protein